MIQIIVVLVAIIAFVSCGDGLQVTKSSSLSEGDLGCKIENKTLAMPTQKIQRDEFYMMSDDQKKSDQLSILASGDIRFAKDTVFALTVNNSCLLDRMESGQAQSYALTKALKVRAKQNKFSPEDTHLLKWNVAIELSALEVLANEDECVVLLSPHLTLTTQSTPNDTRYSEQKHLNAINFEANYDAFFNETDSIKNDTVIAIIDNGVDINHTDLQGHLWQNMTEKNGTTGVDDDGNGYTDDVFGYDFATNVADPNHKYPAGGSIGNSHGSHVAGLTAAVTNNGTGVAGVMASKAKIMALNVFGNSNGAATSNIDNAIRYAADMGAKVINMSLGGPGATSSTQRAIEYAVSKGTFVVVAAGNDGKVLSSSFFVTPASYGAGIDGMLTIGATDSNPNSVGDICSFSNRSTTYVELGAPGCETGKSGVLSLLRSNSYGLMQGTSMASPVAAGVAAVVFSYVRDHYKKTLTPAELETFLKTGSKNFLQLDSHIKDGKNADLTTLREKMAQDFSSGGDTGCP